MNNRVEPPALRQQTELTDRAPDGRFALGNSGGPGNPHAQRVAKLRAAMMAAVSNEDVQQILTALIAAAKEGDVVAAREVLDRLLGKPTTAVAVELTGPVLTIEERRTELLGIVATLRERSVVDVESVEPKTEEPKPSSTRRKKHVASQETQSTPRRAKASGRKRGGGVSNAGAGRGQRQKAGPGEGGSDPSGGGANGR